MRKLPDQQLCPLYRICGGNEGGKQICDGRQTTELARQRSRGLSRGWSTIYPNFYIPRANIPSRCSEVRPPDSADSFSIAFGKATDAGVSTFDQRDSVLIGGRWILTYTCNSPRIGYQGRFSGSHAFGNGSTSYARRCRLQ